MARLMAFWKVEYKLIGFNFVETEIKRNIVHSQFNRDDFSNNFGLFEHLEAILSNEYAVLSKSLHTNDIILRSQDKNIKIVNWQNNVGLRSESQGKMVNTVHRISNRKCHDYAAPVVGHLRNYEFCVILTPRKETSFYHGAVVFVGSKAIGFFSWGDRNGNGFPFVIINVAYYISWLQNIIELNNVSSIVY